MVVLPMEGSDPYRTLCVLASPNTQMYEITQRYEITQILKSMEFSIVKC